MLGASIARTSAEWMRFVNPKGKETPSTKTEFVMAENVQNYWNKKGQFVQYVGMLLNHQGFMHTTLPTTPMNMTSKIFSVFHVTLRTICYPTTQGKEISQKKRSFLHSHLARLLLRLRESYRSIDRQSENGEASITLASSVAIVEMFSLLPSI